MTLQELKAEIDIDIDGSLARFSNFEPMYLKYLKRFINEPTYEALEKAVQEQDFKGIESGAHTMKGIAGNLGLTALVSDFNNIVKQVRAGNNEEALKLCAEVAPKVAQARAAISKLN